MFIKVGENDEAATDEKPACCHLVVEHERANVRHKIVQRHKKSEVLHPCQLHLVPETRTIPAKRVRGHPRNHLAAGGEEVAVQLRASAALRARNAPERTALWPSGSE